MAFFNKKYFENKEVSVFQALFEVREYFDKIREWNRHQVDPPQGSLEPELLLIKEMANF